MIKNIPTYFIALFIFSSLITTAQEIELKRDSLFHARWANLSSGDDRPDIDTEAVSFDELDRELQIRTFSQKPDANLFGSIRSFEYIGDTMFYVNERLIFPDSVWTYTSRSSYFPVSELETMGTSEIYQDGEWLPNSLSESTFDENGNRIEHIIFRWNGTEHFLSSRVLRFYNENNLEIEAIFSSTDQKGVESVFQILETDYDEQSRQTAFRRFQILEDTLALNREFIRTFEEDFLIQTSITTYTATDTFQSRNEYVYLDNGVVEQYGWSNNPGTDWVLQSKFVTHETEKTIGNPIDSSFSYLYYADVDTFELRNRKYYEYFEIDSASLLYTQQTESLDNDNNIWNPLEDQEEYFHYALTTTDLKEDIKDTESILVFPNPTLDFVHLDAGLNNIKQVKVYDQSGKEFSYGSPADYLLDLSDLPSGIYFIQIQDNDKYYVQKVLKM